MRRRTRSRPSPTVKYQPVIVLKMAGDDGIERVKRWDPNTGVPFLAHPVTGEEFPRPHVGSHFSDYDSNQVDPPDFISLPMSYPSTHPEVVSRTGARVVHRPGGPKADPWRVTHTFVVCDELVFHMIDGDHRYRVVAQPGKFDSDGNDCDESGAGDASHEVRWYYLAERV